MRVIVTGSDGVIGQSLVPALEAAGYEVRHFDIRRDFFQNINNPMSVKRAFADFKPDVCIHMAAQVGRLNGEIDPPMSVETNIVGTYNVANACIEHNCRLLNFSTSEVYGHNSVYGEPDILAQNGVYGLTKLAAEGLLAHLADYRGLECISVRPFMVYGPHEVPNGEFRSAVSNFIDTAMRGGTITAHAGCVRSWCYVDDFVDGILLLLNDNDVWDSYKAISIGTDEYRTMEECARAVIDTVENGAYTVTSPPEFLVSAVKKADFSFIRSLGHEPQVTLEEGVRRTYEWMRSR